MVHCCFMLFSVVRANGILPFKRLRAIQYKSAVKVEGNPRDDSLSRCLVCFSGGMTNHLFRLIFVVTASRCTDDL